jgi:Bacterial SCP ortholog
VARRLQQLATLDRDAHWLAWRSSQDRDSERALVKHYLAVLEAIAPGNSVEVRIPPYAAVQVVPGVRHTRGTPPAVVELDGTTWLALASGELEWQQALAEERVRASGERTDLTPYLPLP